MSHKVHPKVFRIKETTDWNSRGFYKKPATELEEDFRIRSFLKKKIGKLGVEKIEIERFTGKINVIINSVRPGLIIGRGGGGVEELKKELEKEVFGKTMAASTKATKPELKIEIREVKDPWASAELTAQYISQQIV